MISLADIYHVLAAMVPLYVTMFLAYVSVKWWKLFTPEQCSGINKFVAKFSIPLLSFHVISTNNPYRMNLKLILSDSLQKLFAIFILTATNKISSRGSLDGVITGLSLSTLPNTLILGIPLLRAMYGNEAATLLAQIVVLQSIIWYNLLLLLFEFRAAQAASLTIPLEATGTVHLHRDRNYFISRGTTDGELKEFLNMKFKGILKTSTPEALTTQNLSSISLFGLEELEAPHTTQSQQEEEEVEVKSRNQRTKIKLILRTVGTKLISNPNTHATWVGLIWAIISFRWELKLPTMIDKSISILSDGGLGMAMFSLGLFMASQARIMACGTRLAALAMGMKFLVGPALMVVASLAIGLRGKLFRIAIVQAALPQGVVPFVFAKEYNLHADILSTGVIFGMLITLPISLAYYFLLEL